MTFINKNFSCYVLFICLFCIHIYLNDRYRHVEQVLPIINDAPKVNALKINALGNDEYLFRYYTIQLQNSGDTFGRFEPLRNYNYRFIRNWMMSLDSLNNKSSVLPALASYYYSNTQNIKDNVYLVEYLEQNYDQDPFSKWWWLSQAISISRFKLRDNDLALKLALKLKNNPNPRMPKWAKQLAALVYNDLGERDLAFAMIKELLENKEDYSQSELNYMSYFIKEKLKIEEYKIQIEPKYKDTLPY